MPKRSAAAQAAHDKVSEMMAGVAAGKEASSALDFFLTHECCDLDEECRAEVIETLEPMKKEVYGYAGLFAKLRLDQQIKAVESDLGAVPSPDVLEVLGYADSVIEYGEPRDREDLTKAMKLIKLRMRRLEGGSK